MKKSIFYKIPLGSFILLYVVCLACNKPSAVRFDDTFITPHTSSNVFDTSLYLNILSQGTEIVHDTFRVASNVNSVPVGFISTSQYGTVKATSYIQYKPSSLPTSLKGKNRRLDSAIFLLRCFSFEGDTLAANAIEVHEVTDADFAQRKKTKFQNNSISINPTPLGSYAKNFHQFRLDKTSDHVSSYTNVIRVHLDDSWGEKFLLQDNTTGLKSDSLYNIFSNGFALVPNESASTNMLYCNVRDTGSRLIVYYKFDDTDDKEDTTHIVLSNVTLSAFATEVTRDRAGSDAALSLAKETDIKEFYLQTQPNGSHIIIEPPSLNFLSENTIISKAELILEDKPFSIANTSFNRPSQLYIDVLDEDEDLRKPIPLLLAAPSVTYTFFPTTFGHTYLQGTYESNDKIKDFRGYRINFTRYAQAMLKGTQKPKNFKVWAPYFIAYENSSTEKTSVLYSTNTLLAQSGIRLYGSDSQEKKSIRLRIVYTK